MRDYRLCVPRDCVAANTAALGETALEQIQHVLKADTTPSAQLRLDLIATRRK
jgi:hypothetical protein